MVDILDKENIKITAKYSAIRAEKSMHMVLTEDKKFAIYASTKGPRIF